MNIRGETTKEIDLEADTLISFTPEQQGDETKGRAAAEQRQNCSSQLPMAITKKVRFIHGTYQGAPALYLA